MKVFLLALTTLIALSTLEVAHASEEIQVIDSSLTSRSAHRRRRRHASPRHSYPFKQGFLKRQRLRQRFPFRRKRVFIQPHRRIRHRHYVHPFPSLKKSHHFHRESYLHDYPSRRTVRIRPSSGVTFKPGQSSVPSRIHVNSVPTLESIRTLPSEFVGLDKGDDKQGLAKQIVFEMGHDFELKPLLKTLKVTQQDNRVIFKGQVPSQALLNRVVAMSETMQGIKTIDTQQVMVLFPD